MLKTRIPTLLSVYWVIVAAGFAPLAWLAYQYAAADPATADTPIHLVLKQPLFGLSFVILFLAAAGIAVIVKRALLVLPALALLALGVIPAYSSLSVLPERAGYEAQLQEDGAVLRTDVDALLARLNGTTIARRSCKWTGWVNNWDKKVSYVCPKDQFLVGAQSVHQNRTEDRRWKFNCCALTLQAK